MTEADDWTLYAVADAHGRCKIGITRQPVQTRLRAIETAIGEPLTLLRSQPLPCEVARNVERAAFALLARHRLHGEWVRAPIETVKDVIDAAIRSPLPAPPIKAVRGVPTDLWRESLIAAQASGITMGEFLNRALRRELATCRKPAPQTSPQGG